mmetsp:Transcript_74125/g.162235  ORF Transcript_74125/g.162235 Transcript_74125/m.162235 type:complete len:200 (-) Transcript_74125:33-632(-)
MSFPGKWCSPSSSSSSTTIIDSVSETAEPSSISVDSVPEAEPNMLRFTRTSKEARNSLEQVRVRHPLRGSLYMYSVLFVLLAGKLVIVDGETTSAQKFQAWKICTKICKAASGNLLTIDSGTAGTFALQCWSPSSAGTLRILDAQGVALVAYQSCAYGATKSAKPLYLTQLTRASYRLSFTNPKRTDGRQVFLDLAARR